MATIGQSLLSPESGWKRFEEGSFRLSGTGFRIAANASVSGGYSFYGNTAGNSGLVEFKFTGTKLRVMGRNVSTAGATYKITIDGVTQDAVTSGNYSALLFEKLGLPLQEHICKIEINIITGGGGVEVDCVDIDNSGQLFHPDEVTDISQLQIGKRISCDYTALASGALGTFANLGKATKNLIPATPPTTPDGSFYWMMVDTDYKGRKILLSDRNIQTSVSWDVLNTAGIASGSGVLLDFLLTPLAMTSNSQTIGTTSYVASASSEYDAINMAYKAFNNSGGTSQRWISASGANQWLQIYSSTPKIIKRYSVMCNDASIMPSAHPKSWRFEGSNNGTTWDILDTQTGQTLTNGVDSVFRIPLNTKSYTYHRIYITENAGYNAAYWTFIDELKLYGFESASFSPYIRLLTGGISSAEKDSEWDKYLVNSTLNGTIAAGDNTVWNWTGTTSWTSTVLASDSTNRIQRGSTVASTYQSGVTYGTAASTAGFRPVLIIEQLPTLKYLIKDNTGYKKFDEITWSTVTSTTPTENDFKTNGMNDLSSIPVSALQQLTNPQIVQWTDDQSATSRYLRVTGVYKPLYKYKIELAGSETPIKAWTPFTQSTTTDSVTIPVATFTQALNPYTVKVTAEQIDGTQVTNQASITLYDTEPTLVATLEGRILKVQVGDLEGDKVQFKVNLNGAQIYPASGFTTLLEPPVAWTKVFSNNEILIGQNNSIEITAVDQFGKQSVVPLNFVGEYSGIMFADEKGSYYATDMGEILQYLDFGTIIASQITLPKKVRVINKNGFPITNLVLSADTSSISSHTKVELSRTEEPFLPESVIRITENLEYNDEIPIFVRIVTDKNDNPHSGIFDILASADPS